MNRMVKILMERDGLTESEARNEYTQLREDVLSAVEDGDFFGAEDIMLDMGFEMDYVADLFI